VKKEIKNWLEFSSKGKGTLIGDEVKTEGVEIK
jgi:hypothetical protein